MHISIRRPGELNPDELTVWRDLVQRYPRYSSPFYHPVYSRELGRFRKRVEVAILSEEGRPVGFLPFERHGRAGRPLGIRLCDFQGAITAPGQHWNVRDLLNGARLSVLHFDHLLDDSSPLASTAFRRDRSPYLDLARGYDAYIAERKESGTTQIAQTLRKRRKLEREHGRLEFRWHDADDNAWEQLLLWKTAQRKRTKTVNILQRDWVREFLDRVRTLQSGELNGVISTLRVDGRLIAVHLGMHTARVLHHWFPAYEREFYRYSPGLIMLLELARACSDRQIGRIDLGKGADGYKYSFATDVQHVLTGAADLHPVRSALRAGCHHAGQWIKRSPVSGPAQLPKRILRRLQHRLYTL